MKTRELKLNYEEAFELYYFVTKRVDELSRLQFTSLNCKHILRLQELQSRLVDVLNSFNDEN